MTRAFIGFGSNLGDGRQLVLSAWRHLEAKQALIPRRLSSLYLTEAVGMVSHSFFTNAVGQVETELEPSELLSLLLRVEAAHGRRRDENIQGYQDRSLDLDLLYFGDTVCNLAGLCLPHPQIASRLFVLAPLTEIAPGLEDPVTGQSVAELYQQLQDRIEQGIVPAQVIYQIEPSG